MIQQDFPIDVRLRCLHARIIAMLVVILIFMLTPLKADALPEESAAPLLSEGAVGVRYWGGLDTVPLRTVQGMGHVNRAPKQTDPRLLVVLYHNIVFGRTGNIYNRDLYNFEHDLVYLQKTTTVIDFDALVRGVFDNTDHSIITFDDGDLSIYAIVFPLLKRYEIPATFFIVPNFIGEVGYMSWQQLREIVSYRTEEGKQLFHVGSHSLTHRKLSTLPLDEVKTELTESKRILEQRLGQSITVLALPFGDGAGDPAITRLAKEAGYSIIRTSQSKAVRLDQLDLLSIPAFNVENYSTDQFSVRAHTLLGR